MYHFAIDSVSYPANTLGMDTKMNLLPHPTDARKRAGLSTRDLRKKGGFSLATINWCESHGQYPRNQGTRVAYFAALGLPLEQVTDSVAKKEK